MSHNYYDLGSIKRDFYYFQFRENGFMMAEAKSREGIEKIMQENFGLPAQVIDNVLRFQEIPSKLESSLSEARKLRDEFLIEARELRDKFLIEARELRDKPLNKLKHLGQVFGQNVDEEKTLLQEYEQKEHEITQRYEQEEKRITQQYKEGEQKIRQQYEQELSLLSNKEYVLKNPHFEKTIIKKVRDFSLLHGGMLGKDGKAIEYNEYSEYSEHDDSCD